MKSVIRRIVLAILTAEARYLISRFQPKIIFVAGSVGKTSTKDAIFSALSGTLEIQKNQKSLNSEFGVPLTILGLKSGWGSVLSWVSNVIVGAWRAATLRNYPDWLVLEVGADHPGDVAAIVAWLKPTVSVLTRMGEIPVHIEFFASREALVEEDMKVAYALNPGGFLITNADDPDFSKIHLEHEVRTISYGRNPQAVVRGEKYEIVMKEGIVEGIKFDVVLAEKTCTIVRKGVVGEHHMYPALAAVATALAVEIGADRALEGLAAPENPPGRMRLIPGLKNTQLIDDSYNSSPVAAVEALKALHAVREALGKGRRIAILGDMKELGHHTKEEHVKIGHLAAQLSDILVTVGVASRETAEGALDAGMAENNIFQFDEAREAGKFVEGLLQYGDVVLIKGSQSIRMERAVKEIMAEPDRVEKILCRQDEAWKVR